MANGVGGNGSNGNGLATKVVGVIVTLALSGLSAMILKQLDQIAATQQIRGERLTAAEARAHNNASRLDRLEAVLDRQVQQNSQKIDTLEERLRRMEQKKEQ